MSKLIVQSKNSERLKTLLNGAIENELKIIKFGISRTEKLLHDLEKKFNMKTDHFYGLFVKGQFGDDDEYIRWAGEVETLDRLKRELNELTEVEIC